MSRHNENGYDSDGVGGVERPLDGPPSDTPVQTGTIWGWNGAETITKLYLRDLIPSHGRRVITFKLQN